MQNICPQKNIQLLVLRMLFCIAAQSQLSIDSSKFSVYNIIGYGAIGNGKISNTAAIQKAINDCHKSGGGTIVIPAGNFINGAVRLFNNMKVYFEAGAVLTSSTENKEYLYQKDFGFSDPGAGIKTGILAAHREQNIAISGYDIIKGNGISFMYMDSLQCLQENIAGNGNNEITLRNTKQVAVNITINDQFPVSTAKEINIDDQKVPDAQVNKDTGIATWTITLQAGQEKKLGIS